MNEMLEKSKAAQANAYAAYSNFKVGACIRSHNAQYFVGCNYENAAYSVTCCAEGVAIGAMIAAGYREILEMVLIGASEEVCTPCGMCRQRIREFAAPHMLIHMFNHDASKQLSKTLDELLPYSFGPEHVQ
jgi:cytidine deaminase